MSSLVFVPGIGYKNPEYLANENKDILFIWLYANDPNNLDPGKKLTLKHFAVIKKAALLKKDPTKYANLKINSQEFEDRAVMLNDLIKYINHYHKEITTCGMKVDDDQRRKAFVIEGVKKYFPDFTQSQLDEGYQLSEFLNVLERGLIYEQQYLDSLMMKFEKTSDNIKQEFDLQSLKNL